MDVAFLGYVAHAADLIHRNNNGLRVTRCCDSGAQGLIFHLGGVGVEQFLQVRMFIPEFFTRAA